MENIEVIKAIIIDDEIRAIRTLQSLIELLHFPVEIVGTAQNIPEGVKIINKHNPDLVFLDIEMPEYNGFELLDFFKEIDFEIIFVTAYNEYALRAFEASAIDYLLKPVDQNLLEKAIQKATKKIESSQVELKLELLRDAYKNEQFQKIALPTAEGLFFIDTKEIVFFEADGAYTEVWLSHGSKMVISKKLKFFEDVLENNPFFFRTHRSYLVNINHIDKYSRKDSLISLRGNKYAQVARNKKADFEKNLKDLKITVG
ncbi:MAG: LytTR family DNA-binding domain-containing protein [Brumimicrobium sp.]|nr:LytTR family DNA-binding domain-containing protein [Brumimicrobium sp.]